MQRLLATIEERFGGALGWLTAHGWTSADQKALRRRLTE